MKKINPDLSRTLYIGGVYEVNKSPGGTVTRTVTYYPAGGAMRIDGALYFVLKDHLGSASVVTDATGNIVGENRYYPYGETRLTTGTMYTDKLYTGQREVTGLGIYHYQARFYSPRLGRFLSADSIVPSYVNPQNLSHYSYVVNNPIKLTDPSGHRCVGEAEECTNIFGKPINGSGRSTSWVNPVKPMNRGGGHDFRDGHPGVDLNPDSNENPNPEIVASSYGMVYSSTPCTIDPCFNSDGVDANDGYGNVVIIGYDYYYLPSSVQANIPEGSTLFILYAHLETPSSLNEGDIVIPGQLIGNVGNTGNSDGTHLHMEIRIEEDDPLPVGNIHNDAGYTDVHFTWHLLLTPLNPHDFFDIPCSIKGSHHE